MKLKILKDIRLANKKPSLEPWLFKKGDLIDTCHRHLIKRLFELEVAEELKGAIPKGSVFLTAGCPLRGNSKA